jgi:hypothetical protein
MFDQTFIPDMVPNVPVVSKKKIEIENLKSFDFQGHKSKVKVIGSNV